MFVASSEASQETAAAIWSGRAGHVGKDVNLVAGCLYHPLDVVL